jgi:uncharacterized damage-inducible protein DinB
MSITRTTVAEPMERRWPAAWADDELRLQWEFLSFLRVTVVNKLAGLDTARAAATPLATSPSMSLIGLVKHLTAVERWWLSIVGGGADLPTLWDDDDSTADFRVREGDSPASAVEAYRQEWARAAESLAGLSAGDPTRGTNFAGERPTVRWVLSHVIQETARHVGHVDILRELADGARGE